MKLSLLASNLQELIKEGYGDFEVEFEFTDYSGEENIQYTMQKITSVESYNGASMYDFTTVEEYKAQEEKDWICFELE